MPERPLTPKEAGWLDRVGMRAAELGMTTLVDDVAFARRAMRQRANARAQINRLRRDIPLPILELPAMTDAITLAGLAALGQQLAERIETPDASESSGVQSTRISRSQRAGRKKSSGLYRATDGASA